MLWLAADFNLPANQEPALSEELEGLLISMTQDDPDLRPSVDDVLKVRYQIILQELIGVE